MFSHCLNFINSKQKQSLHHASHKGHLKVVQKLLKLGADPLIHTFDYMYPFDLAENAGFTSVRDTDGQKTF